MGANTSNNQNLVIQDDRINLKHLKYLSEFEKQMILNQVSINEENKLDANNLEPTAHSSHLLYKNLLHLLNNNLSLSKNSTLNSKTDNYDGKSNTLSNCSTLDPSLLSILLSENTENSTIESDYLNYLKYFQDKLNQDNQNTNNAEFSFPNELQLLNLIDNLTLNGTSNSASIKNEKSTSTTNNKKHKRLSKLFKFKLNKFSKSPVENQNNVKTSMSSFNLSNNDSIQMRAKKSDLDRIKQNNLTKSMIIMNNNVNLNEKANLPFEVQEVKENALRATRGNRVNMDESLNTSRSGSYSVLSSMSNKSANHSNNNKLNEYPQIDALAYNEKLLKQKQISNSITSSGCSSGASSTNLSRSSRINFNRLESSLSQANNATNSLRKTMLQPTSTTSSSSSSSTSSSSHSSSKSSSKNYPISPLLSSSSSHSILSSSVILSSDSNKSFTPNNNADHQLRNTSYLNGIHLKAYAPDIDMRNHEQNYHRNSMLYNSTMNENNCDMNSTCMNKNNVEERKLKSKSLVIENDVFVKEKKKKVKKMFSFKSNSNCDNKSKLNTKHNDSGIFCDSNLTNKKNSISSLKSKLNNAKNSIRNSLSVFNLKTMSSSTVPTLTRTDFYTNDDSNNNNNKNSSAALYSNDLLHGRSTSSTFLNRSSLDYVNDMFSTNDNLKYYYSKKPSIVSNYETNMSNINELNELDSNVDKDYFDTYNSTKLLKINEVQNSKEQFDLNKPSQDSLLSELSNLTSNQGKLPISYISNIYLKKENDQSQLDSNSMTNKNLKRRSSLAITVNPVENLIDLTSASKFNNRLFVDNQLLNSSIGQSGLNKRSNNLKRTTTFHSTNKTNNDFVKYSFRNPQEYSINASKLEFPSHSKEGKENKSTANTKNFISTLQIKDPIRKEKNPEFISRDKMEMKHSSSLFSSFKSANPNERLANASNLLNTLSTTHSCQFIPSNKKHIVNENRMRTSNSNHSFKMNNPKPIDSYQSTVQQSANLNSANNTSRPQKIVVQASTSDLLRCFAEFISQTCPNLIDSENESLDYDDNEKLDPRETIIWLRSADRALLVQGWEEIAFMNPVNVVFVYLLVKESLKPNKIRTANELKCHIMACLYLAFSYMGNEISYPLKPFLVEQNRDIFWSRMVNLMNTLSSSMLRINQDSKFFTDTFYELRSYSKNFLNPTVDSSLYSMINIKQHQQQTIKPNKSNNSLSTFTSKFNDQSNYSLKNASTSISIVNNANSNGDANNKSNTNCSSQINATNPVVNHINRSSMYQFDNYYNSDNQQSYQPSHLLHTSTGNYFQHQPKKKLISNEHSSLSYCL